MTPEKSLPAQRRRFLILDDCLSASLDVESLLAHQPGFEDVAIESYERLEGLLDATERGLRCDLVLIVGPLRAIPLLESLIKIRAHDQETPILVLNEPGHEKTAVLALKNGATFYLPKDENFEEHLPDAIYNVLVEHHRNLKQRDLAKKPQPHGEMIKGLGLENHASALKSAIFEEHIAREVHRAQRYGCPVSCLVFEVGATPRKDEDEQNSLPLLLKAITRKSDFVTQLGPSQFGALLPHTTPENARLAATRIRSELAASAPREQTSTNIKVGLATFPDEKIWTEIDLLREAQASCYRPS